MVFVEISFRNDNFSDKKIKVMITPEDHFLKPCPDYTLYQSQGRISGRNYVQTNAKNYFNLKKEQHGTLLLCGLSS